MSAYEKVKAQLKAGPKRWLVTGAAGFIGSHLTEELLRLGQQVVGLDNLATGYRSNLESVRGAVGDHAWKNFKFLEGDICDPQSCVQAANGVHAVLHQAALGSVPRSIEEPLASHATNVTGFINVLAAARDVRARFVFASSSSVYGDSPALPKVEDTIGDLLSPYAATKLIGETYSWVFARCYGMEAVGLRYFNVFGPRQDPNGAYAAVIPRWIDDLLQNRTVTINVDGETSRDFCYIANVVQANILAATASNPASLNRPYNIGLGEQTTLNQLYRTLRSEISPDAADPVYQDFRAGDVRHSRADISRAENLLGYSPTVSVPEGLRLTVDSYRAKMRRITSSIGTS